MLDRFLSAVDAVDDRIDSAWNVLRGRPVIDRVFYTASELADFSLLWHLLGTGRSLVPPADPRIVLRLSAALGIESALVNGAVKSLFGRSRPVVDVERPLHLRVPRTSSFPSGHASSAFMAATLLADRDPHLEAVYFGLAALVATSRVHVRIHHASDVAAGAMLGLVLGQIVKRTWPV
jgi:undecaprenyl-diphosphatase